MKDGKCPICKVGGLLVIIGALNWGSIGLFGTDFVAQLLGGLGANVVRVVYILVGVAGVLALVSCFKGCPACKK